MLGYISRYLENAHTHKNTNMKELKTFLPCNLFAILAMCLKKHKDQSTESTKIRLYITKGIKELPNTMKTTIRTLVVMNES